MIYTPAPNPNANRAIEQDATIKHHTSVSGIMLNANGKIILTQIKNIMRFLSILALSAMALTATAQNYTVNGSADSSLEGKKVYLIDQNHHLAEAFLNPKEFELIPYGAALIKNY